MTSPTPIAARLRRWPCKEDAHIGISEIMAEAASEIDRLTKLLADVTSETAIFCASNAELTNEVLRLRDLTSALAAAEERAEKAETLLVGWKNTHAQWMDATMRAEAGVSTPQARCAELEEHLAVAIRVANALGETAYAEAWTAALAPAGGEGK